MALAACVGMTFTAATPASATSSSAAAIDLPAPARDTGPTSTSTEDSAFRNLYAQWESLDSGSKTENIAPVAQISIPSRMPLDNAHLTSSYGMRTHPVLRKRSNHRGVDLAAPIGTPIYATADGIVSRADRFGSYGLYISIEHGGQLQTRFAHLSRLAVAEGQTVKKGDIIGYVGSTGRSTGPHLHYEVRIANVAVNPIPYMQESAEQKAQALAAQ